jgi:hypothetical protein
MKDGAKEELTEILAAYRARLIESQERQAKIKADRASFIELYRNLKTTTIRPVLEDFVAQLNQEGHVASVVDQGEASDRNGAFTPASIALRVVPSPIGGGPSAPSGNAEVEVKFSANQQAMKVLVSSTNNAQGSSGKRGEYDLAELTEDFVVSNVLKTIRDAFAKSR